MVATFSPWDLSKEKLLKMTMRPGHPGQMGKLTPEEL